MADGGIFAVVNPLHLRDDVRAMQTKLGPERSGVGRSYAWRSMADAGVSIALGSDWPLVAPLDPLASVLAAHDRLGPSKEGEEEGKGKGKGKGEGKGKGKEEGEGPLAFHPEESLSIEEALVATTRTAAQAGFMEAWVGTLEVGKLGDFAVLDRDLLAHSPGEERPAVLSTFVGGVIQYAHNAAPT